MKIIAFVCVIISRQYILLTFFEKEGKTMDKAKSSLITPNSALLIIDVQNDFCPGGALAVPGGDEVVKPINKVSVLFLERNFDVIATRDWHPENSKHFKDNGGVWPKHCVQGTTGAMFNPNLWLPWPTSIISKGVGENEDGYSPFENKWFAPSLRKNGVNVDRLFIGGLATDYCVKFSVLDALKEGFEAFVLEDAIRAVNINPGDGDKAIEEMKKAGAKFVTTAEALGK